MRVNCVQIKNRLNLPVISCSSFVSSDNIFDFLSTFCFDHSSCCFRILPNNFCILFEGSSANHIKNITLLKKRFFKFHYTYHLFLQIKISLKDNWCLASMRESKKMCIALRITDCTLQIAYRISW